jgi:uncharacterized protein (DUF433 family)
VEDWFDSKGLRPDYVPTGWVGYGVKARAVPGHPLGSTCRPVTRMRSLLSYDIGPRPSAPTRSNSGFALNLRRSPAESRGPDFWFSCRSPWADQLAQAYNRVVANAFDRITQNPNVLGGRATIRGLRISVAHVINLVANGMTPAQIVSDLPDLEEKDIRQALAYAAALAQDELHTLRA